MAARTAPKVTLKVVAKGLKSPNPATRAVAQKVVTNMVATQHPQVSQLAQVVRQTPGPISSAPMRQIPGPVSQAPVRAMVPTRAPTPSAMRAKLISRLPTSRALPTPAPSAPPAYEPFAPDGVDEYGAEYYLDADGNPYYLDDQGAPYYYDDATGEPVYLDPAVMGAWGKKLKKAAKAVKKHNYKKDIAKLNKVAKVIGPEIAKVAPAPYDMYLKTGLAILDGVDKLNQGDLDKVAEISAGVAAGDPQAAEAMAMLNLAQQARKSGKAGDLLQAAQLGDPSALAKLGIISNDAAAGIPGAKDALETLEIAKRGLTVKAEIKVG
jgi:hypothetical protein